MGDYPASMNNEARPSKDAAIRLARRLAPAYGELFTELQRGGGRFRFGPRMTRVMENVSFYVKLYDDERRINAAIVIGAVGEDPFKELLKQSHAWTYAQQAAFVEEMIKDADEILSSFDEIQWPTSEVEWQAEERKFLSLPVQEQIALRRKSSFLFSGLFSGFFNTLSLMVHGVKLTRLIPQAMRGNDDAFLKAVQIDKRLVIYHPYFRERKQLAQAHGAKPFLSKLLYREANPPLRGKVRFPALYMVFGILESVGWLKDVKHDEILDICCEAGLHRYQNRIDDVNCVTKRLLEYHRWQNTGGVSMH